MKILRTGLIVFVVFLFIIFAGGWIFLSTLDVNRYVPQAADAVARMTGRELKIGHAGLKCFVNKGVVLELNNVSLSDDARFSEKPFVKISRVVLALDVRALLVERSIVISEVGIISPEFMVIRGKDGTINAATVGAPTGASAGTPDGASAGAPAGAPASSSLPPLSPSGSGAVVVSSPSWPLLLVKKIQVKGGTVHYCDRLFDPAIMLDIEKITLDVKNFSFNALSDMVLSAAVFAVEPDVFISGRAGVDGARLSARLEDVKASFRLEKVLPARLNIALPMIKPAGFKQAGGVVDVRIKKAVFGAKGVEELDAQAVLDVRDAVLEGFNILSAGLNSIPMFPDLVDTILADLPPETQEDVRKRITVIDRLEALVSVSPDLLTVRNAELSARDLVCSGNGTVKLSGELDLLAKLFIAPKLSQALLNKVPDLGGLMKDDGRLYIPFSLSGPIMKPVFIPDLDYVTKKLLLKRGKQKLEKLLTDPEVGQAVGKLFNTIFK